MDSINRRSLNKKTTNPLPTLNFTFPIKINSMAKIRTVIRSQSNRIQDLLESDDIGLVETREILFI